MAPTAAYLARRRSYAHVDAPPIEDLRRAIDCLPRATRAVAMLEGVRTQRDHRRRLHEPPGGVCPMLAAHRRGGRTDLISLRARLGPLHRAPRGRAGRPRASCATLEAQLEASIAPRGGAVATEARAAQPRRAIGAGPEAPAVRRPRRLRARDWLELDLAVARAG